MNSPDTSDDTPDNAPGDAPDGAPGTDDAPPKDIEDEIQASFQSEEWREDEDVQIQRAIAIRALTPGGLPGLADVIAMGVVVARLVRGTVLLQDLADATTIQNEPPRPAGLAYIADAMNRDAVRLYRLYHGCPPGET